MPRQRYTNAAARPWSYGIPKWWATAGIVASTGEREECAGRPEAPDDERDDTTEHGTMRHGRPTILHRRPANSQGIEAVEKCEDRLTFMGQAPDPLVGCRP